ncbi:hypothetical protein SPBR_01055 [Sporothrix brasiliensis 5110]|uniref:Mediator of RNA polymerase II transcription subunit 22 n=1 Tax=Sporothrix brasiliensis 5110 TaxID=1398154 RepID=A0A0C2J015_9PEZI|nr:uncharacterized protein SPBR_01055 [Sporothrix brasiliensis 5110]KIH90542.1 hypothetical protein SPBR_01055 [Sporothrix brasiliensis 5110]
MSAPGATSGGAASDQFGDLLDRESQLIAQYMQHASALVMAATSRVSNRSTIGEAAANRLRIDAEVAGLLRTAENLCTLTRRIRELWIVGALRASGAGDAEAESKIRSDVAPLLAQLESMQQATRTRDLGRYGTYQTTATGGPVPQPTQPTQAQQALQTLQTQQTQQASQQSQPPSQPPGEATAS